MSPEAARAIMDALAAGGRPRPWELAALAHMQAVERLARPPLPDNAAGLAERSQRYPDDAGEGLPDQPGAAAAPADAAA